MRSIHRLALVAAALLMPVMGVAQSTTYLHHVYLDTDNSSSTGCAVSAHELGWSGQIVGIERDVTITVQGSATPQVIGVSVASCSLGVWQPPVAVSSGPWPVGLGVGTGGGDVIEGWVPRAMLGGVSTLRLYFHSQLLQPIPPNDVMLLSGGQQGAPMLLALQALELVPALGLPGLLLLAAAIATLAFVVLHRRVPAAAALALAVLVALTSTTAAWAATIVMDGQIVDWQGVTQLGADPAGDSSIGDPAEDILAGFATADTLNVYFRIDVANAEPDTVTFGYTGAVQSFVVPQGVTSIDFDVSGAQGGANWVNNTNFGGRVTATVAVTPGETLLVYVGEQPNGTTGGYNGGGAGETGGQGGGGGSDVRRGAGTLADRLVVGGGGGGAGYWDNLEVVGGIGGGTTGADGYREPDFGTNAGGKGATQSAGGADGTCGDPNVTTLAGAFGQGGAPSGCGCEGYGGGGGWYGGAGSGNCRGGGGGSGYAIPAATNVTHYPGTRAGNGQVILSW